MFGSGGTSLRLCEGRGRSLDANHAHRRLWACHPPVMLVTGWDRGGYVAQSSSRQALFSVGNLFARTVLWDGGGRRGSGIEKGQLVGQAGSLPYFSSSMAEGSSLGLGRGGDSGGDGAPLRSVGLVLSSSLHF